MSYVGIEGFFQQLEEVTASEIQSDGPWFMSRMFNLLSWANIAYLPEAFR